MIDEIIQRVSFGRRVFYRGIEYAVLHTLPTGNLMVVNVDEELPAQISLLKEESLDKMEVKNDSNNQKG